MTSNEIMEQYKYIVSKITDRRQQVQNLIKMLSDETSWNESPASSMLKYHCAFKGGLLVHSINVATILLQLQSGLDNSISEESCAIVGLFHDVGKVGWKGQPMYTECTSDWHRKNQGKMFNINENILFLDVPTRSLMHISKYVDLTPEEMQAIRYHDGQYAPENEPVKMKECNLTLLLQMADVWATKVYEKNEAK